MFAKQAVSVIITSWNRWDVFDCINSVMDNTNSARDYEVVVFDNGSTSDIVKELRHLEGHGCIKLLVNEGPPKSWAWGMNEITRLCTKDWMTVPSLANDFLATEGWLEAMDEAIGTSKENPRYIQWAFAPVLENGQLQPEGFGGYVLEPARYAHASSEDPDYTGHALVSKLLWDCVGIYDEQFEPIYMEDVDWGIRLHMYLAEKPLLEALKYTPAIRLVKDSKIIHRKAGTVRGHGAAAWGANRERLLCKYPELQITS
jgi:GT2 family glycosyltransferase